MSKRSEIIFIARPFLTPSQYRLLSSVFSNLGQAVILFSLAALFVPEAVTLKPDFSIIPSLLFLISGLTLILIAVILVKKGKI